MYTQLPQQVSKLIEWFETNRLSFIHYKDQRPDPISSGISVENLLSKSGLSKKLERKHTEGYFKHWLKEGSIMKIQDSGLKKEK